ncbi:hypothetical protein NECID01_1670, partial [Nematocida sp. AWRm77]
MKTIKVILTVITFAVVCICQIEVDFILRNNSIIRVTVPEGTFHVIDNPKSLDSSHTENSNISSPKKTKTEENVRVALCEFESMTEYEQFRQLWDIDSSALSTKDSASAQEQISLTEDLSKDMFEKCLLTADSLRIQGEYAKRFAENMVKYGLLRRHSEKIMPSKDLSNYDLSHDIFWSLLHAFLRQTGFEYRLTHPSAGQTMLRIEKADAWPRKINDEYTGPSQTTRMRTVLHSTLGPAGSLEKERNEVVLAWLLLNIGGSSVDIQYTIEVVSDDTTEVSQTIYNLAKENNKEASVGVEGLALGVGYDSIISLRPLLQLIPDLSRLELINKEAWKSRELSSFISRDISFCRYLKVLRIQGLYLESADVSSLVGSIPNIEQLSLLCEGLEDTAAESFKACKKLEKLDLDGWLQTSSTVQEIVKHLPHLRELTIECERLDSAA